MNEMQIDRILFFRVSCFAVSEENTGWFLIGNACRFPLSLVNLFYLRKWNLLCICMSGISPRFPYFFKFAEERRVKCHLWDIENGKIVL